VSRILVTGGAGYVGSVLVPLLLNQGHEVRVLDNMMYGGDALIPNFTNPSFEFVRGDILDPDALGDALRDMEVIIHLAAIVGYPACRRNKRLAEEVNLEGSQLVNEMRGRDQLVLFASTYSNYGLIIKEEHCTEETPLNPMTTYGRTKAEAEKLFLDSGNAICFRFATAFGVAPRLRLDLLVNDFVFSAVKNKTLIVYEKDFKRCFVHVRDIAQVFLFALENRDRMRDDVFNVGDDAQNYSKEQIALKIRERVEFFLHFAEVGQDMDKRDYFISYEKINGLGFRAEVGMDEGIDELIRCVEAIDVRTPYANV